MYNNYRVADIRRCTMFSPCEPPAPPPFRARDAETGRPAGRLTLAARWIGARAGVPAVSACARVRMCAVRAPSRCRSGSTNVNTVPRSPQTPLAPGRLPVVLKVVFTRVSWAAIEGRPAGEARIIIICVEKKIIRTHDRPTGATTFLASLFTA